MGGLGLWDCWFCRVGVLLLGGIKRNSARELIGNTNGVCMGWDGMGWDEIRYFRVELLNAGMVM